MKKVRVNTDNNYTTLITVLGHKEREEIKGYKGGDFTDYAHWHSFLEGIELSVGPSYEEYVKWKKTYEGWSYGAMTKDHSAWKEGYSKKKHPMNFYYRKIGV